MLKRRETLRGWEKLVTFLRQKTLRGLRMPNKPSDKLQVCWTDLENAFGSLRHDLTQFALDW